MISLEKQLSELESYIPQHDTSNPSVSKVSAGWQIEHALIVIISISKQLKKSEPADFKGKFSFKKLLIFSSGHIPRGVGRSPKQVLPGDNITEEGLRTLLQTAREELIVLSKLPAKSFFAHPFFGGLRLKQTKRFLQIHTYHHLKIVRDILKN
jgi:hypothetical protein